MHNRNIYQTDYSIQYDHETRDPSTRVIKAQKCLSVIKDAIPETGNLDVLEIGCFTGEISINICNNFRNYLAVDIDSNAISIAKSKIKKGQSNISFQKMNAEMLELDDESLDLAICSHVYEHVSDPAIMMDEIFRVLKKDGYCYFAAGNKYHLIEAHHRLPFLSFLSKPLANIYLRIFRGKKYYYENHFSFPELETLTSKFHRIDYTRKIIERPEKYHSTDMLHNGTIKQKLALIYLEYFYNLFPTYIWMLKKVI
jgi:ubiquinone/menaquinone biosynthesis C-methylase UbiE